MQILKQNCTFPVQSILIINRSKQHATCHIRAIRAIRVQENNIIRVMNLSSQFIVKIIHQRRVPLKRVLLHLDERLGAEGLYLGTTCEETGDADEGFHFLTKCFLIK